VALAVSAGSIFGVAGEARSVARTLRSELSSGTGGLLSVSGVLAEQLARELGEGAQPGAVHVGGDVPSRSAEALVRVIAGNPTDVDMEFLRVADGRGTPVVLVQLWPQADWTRPFVLSPFVVECRAGKGFPLKEIADRIVDAAEQSSPLASGIPVLRPSVERKVVLRAVVRAAALGAFKGRLPTRSLITNEQVRMVARLSATNDKGGTGIADEPMALGAVTAAVLASGFAFRGAARTARFVLPAPVANAVVAAAGTWALAKATRIYGSRGSS
jgi:hypothetical protein